MSLISRFRWTTSKNELDSYDERDKYTITGYVHYCRGRRRSHGKKWRICSWKWFCSNRSDALWMINSRGKRVVREAVFLPPLSLWELRTKILMKSASAPMFIRCFRNQAKVPHMLSLIPNSAISASESLKRRLQLLSSWGWWWYLYSQWYPRYWLENSYRACQSLRERYEVCDAKRFRFSIRHQCRFIQVKVLCQIRVFERTLLMLL